MAGDAALAAACCDLTDDLADQRLLVQAPLAGDDEARPEHPLVEAHGAEHVARTRDEPGSEVRPQAAGEPACGAGHRNAARISGGMPSQGLEAAIEPANGGRIRALLRGEDPRGVLPTAPVRFIVLSEGKELYKSPPRTSQDEPLAASVSVSGAKSLTLKVESTLSPPLLTPGLWGDVALVK